MWDRKKASRPKHGKGFVRGYYHQTNFLPESINYLSPI
jgi:hypothetical protein